MPVAQLNGTDIYYEITGDGPPLIFVHGSWSDRNNWRLVAPGLAETHSVVVYDRCGHGLSDRSGRSTRREHEDDLAALIELLDLGPVDLVGTSYGSSTAIGLVTRRPELVRSLIAHEPALTSLVADDPRVQPLLRKTEADVEFVVGLLKKGQAEAGAREFVERVALGPGGWEQLPEAIHQTMIDVAHTYVLDDGDPAGWSVDREPLAGLDLPVLLTKGDASPKWLGPIVDALGEVVPGAEVAVYRGAGHSPHLTDPDQYVEVTSEFLARTREAAVVH